MGLPYVVGGAALSVKNRSDRSVKRQHGVAERPGRSGEGLMLVDNPRLLLKSLCSLRDRHFTAKEYLHVLGSLTKKGHVHEKTRDTYFYTGNIFNLIEETDPSRHRYEITSLCRKICDVMTDRSMVQTYRRYLRGLLLSNKDKGPLFKRFLDYTAQTKKMSEIQEVFKEVPAKTLVAFCVEAGLAVSHGDLIKSGITTPRADLSDFFSTLRESYEYLKANPGRNTTLIYVPIDTIRNLVSVELGLESPELFDACLEKTLDSTYGNSIYLHGAPPQAEPEFHGFRYKKRRYAYISMRNTH